MKAKQLKLILGDQLNPQHSWFRTVDNDVVFVIAELHQEANYTKHHIQKITAFFSAMHEFAKTLESQGHRVCYLTLDDTQAFEDLNALIVSLVKKYDSESFCYQRPDEYRLREQLKNITSHINIPVYEADTEHFLLPFDELPNHFTKATHVRMENFYRSMRKRFNILMEGDKPTGGAWNFDSNNRQAFKKSDIKVIPKPLVFNNDASEYLARIKQHGIKTMGKESVEVAYPINKEQSLTLLRFFCQHQLPNFGNFQDAMTMASPYAWSLYHSRLSFAINCKILNPQEVIQTALLAYEGSEGKITLPQIEGFIRQILGWREYVRGMYWINMPEYADQNFLSAHRDLPDFFWHGKTNMQCLNSAITQSLDHAYAHHIQRLMITGNFALLAGISPKQVDEWYLGIYIDAIEWVELPNTRSMALFADGGWIATKPYAASGNYVNKMSDYCKGCKYEVKEKLGENACPLNSLYWYFIGENYDKLSSNHRMSFPVRNWEKMPEAQKIEISEHANYLLNNLDTL
ncbi:cryptochrome/photolyase family protein [uncultured Psychrosphaera sp.]|uniref:cryptochrome/photolyase family protein n=1 Tax=uncultured Psychrosphaera sp. TaxID=1403522 RepID=UPI002619DF34|nr:cryptochrome/photolyase family protein [uncultured Psychrosphaera sp.]